MSSYLIELLIKKCVALKYRFRILHMIGWGSGCVARRLLATLEDRSSILAAGINNVLITYKSDSLYTGELSVLL